MRPRGVVPHPVHVDQPAAGPLRHLQHGPVDEVRNARDESARRCSPARRPGLPDPFEVAADTAAGHHDGLGGVAEDPHRLARARHPTRYRARGQHIPGHPDASSVDRQGRDQVAGTDRDSWDRMTARRNGSTRAGPVPQVTWNLGTELP